MNAGSLCTRDVVTCRMTTSVVEAARLMRDRHVGDLVVIDDASGVVRPVGLVTDRDIVLSVVAKEVDPSNLFVSDIMSAPAVVAQDADDPWRLAQHMRLHGVRRMPVADTEGRLVGLISINDILSAASGLMSELWLVTGRQVHFEEKRRA